MIQVVKKIGTITIILLCCRGFSQTICAVKDISAPIGISVNVNGVNITGEYAIWYKCFSTPTTPQDSLFLLDNHLTKAFVICEGLDPGNKNDLQSIYRHADGNYFLEIAQKPDMPLNENMLTELRKRGYDIICLNLFDNWSRIQDNAMLFRELLLQVQTQLNANGSKYQITAGGWSIGGLISRYALTYMEAYGEDHRVDNFITFDSPHRGAYVPLPLMHIGAAADQILSLTSNIFPPDNDPIKRLGRELKNPDGVLGQFLQGLDAPKQMLSMWGVNNDLRYQFLSDLNTLGTIPQKCRKIALASGASGTNRFGTTTEGGRFFEWTPGLCLLDAPFKLPLSAKEITIRYCPFAAHLQLNAMPGDFGRILQASIGQQIAILGHNISLDPITDFAFAHDRRSDPGNLDPNLDIVPGSYFPTDALKKLAHDVNFLHTEVDLSWHDRECIPATPVTDEVCQSFGVVSKIIFPWYEIVGRMESDYDFGFTFMPTLSALAVSGSDWYKDVKQIPGYPYIKDRNITPFDIILSSSSNLQHVDISNDVRERLVYEIAPINMYVQNHVFPAGYVNHYEAKTITIDNYSDPEPNRSLVGDVIFSAGSDVDFTVPVDGEIVLHSGVNMQYGSQVYFGKNNNLTQLLPYTSTAPVYLRSASNDLEASASPSSRVTDMADVPITKTFSVAGMGKNASFTNALTAAYNLSVVAYPNPTKANWSVAVNVPNSDNLNIAIYSMDGTLVYEQKGIVITEAGVYKCLVDTDNLARGIYVLKVSGNHQTVNRKLELVY